MTDFTYYLQYNQTEEEKMKVAIMGAGLSGLTCAIMLERHGIYPTIFEKRDRVGDRFICAESMLSVLSAPIADPIRYLSEEFQIYIKPTSHIGELIIHSEHQTASIQEHVGYINIRGRHEQSFEHQLAEQVKSEITFQSSYSYEELSHEFTHVVVATGDASYAAKLRNFREDLSVSLKGATVKGEFERSTVQVWLRSDWAPKGYAYLLPYSNTEANIVIAYPDLPAHAEVNTTTLWNQFYDGVQKELGQTLPITDQFQITNYPMGICNHPRIGNTFFVGSCFGSLMPFLGFGQFESMLTGIYAAYDLCGLGTFEELAKPMRDSYHHSLTLRRAVEGLSNHSFDVVVSGLNGPIGKTLFTRSHINSLKLISYLLRPFVNK